MNGFIDYWHRDRNFGFIHDDAGQSYFAHLSNFNPPLPLNYRLVKGLLVSFEVGRGDKGPVALNIRVRENKVFEAMYASSLAGFNGGNGGAK